MTTIDLLIFAFPSEKNSREALTMLKRMQKEKVIDLVDAAIIDRDDKGKIHLQESADPSGKQGALFGAVTGALVGLLGGPVGAIIGAAAGAGVGGYAAQKIDMGIPNERLKDIAEVLKPGNSAIVALIEHSWAFEATQAMQKYDADIIQESIREEITTRFEALGGKEDAGSISIDEDGGVENT